MMKMTMRWYGDDDPVRLDYIRQVPGMKGIVTALHDLKPGVIWTVEHLNQRKALVEAVGLKFEVVESIPVHESIKIGSRERDQHIESYAESIRNMGKVGVKTLCYNFMPIFDWIRTDLAMPLPDGTTTMQYVQADLAKIRLPEDINGLPAWAETYTAEQLNALREAYQDVDEEKLFENLVYFLKGVVPAAQEAGVYMAIHPDDPPWSIFGLPRIIRNETMLQRMLDAVDNPHNGLTFCTGSLGASRENDLPKMVRRFGKRINFVHARNVKHSSDRDFHEAEHPSQFGTVDMFEVMKVLVEVGFEGPIRPDHGRMIWGETGRPGYGLYDRALGAMYLYGLVEALSRSN